MPLAAERQRRANFWHANVFLLYNAMQELFKTILDDAFYYTIALTVICLTSFGLGLAVGLLMIVAL